MESGNIRKEIRISRVHWNLYAATGGLWVRKNEEEEEDA